MIESSRTAASPAASTTAHRARDDARSKDAPSPQAAAATKTIDAARQAGVVNPGELAKDVGKAYAKDPKAGAALHAAVNEQLSPRDQASLTEHLPQTLGAVAGARAVDRSNTVPQGLTDRQFAQASETVRARAQELNLGSDVVAQGSRVNRTARPGSDLDVAVRASPERFDRFMDTQSRLASPNPGSARERTRNAAIENGRIHAGEARLSPTAAAVERTLGRPVDVAVVRQGGPFDQGPTMEMRSARATSARAAGQGAAVGALVDGGSSAVRALSDGRLTGAEARDVVADTARGATVGATYAVTEQGLIKVADRAAGGAIERSVASTAARLGAAEAANVGSVARVAATRLGGAGAAGAVISAGVSIVENRDGLARGDSRAIGNVAGDVVVGAGAALSGAAAGAAIGSIVPGVGTVAGAIVGLGVGFAADYVMRAGGVDKAVANAVTSGVDAVKGAASTVAGWLGW